MTARQVHRLVVEADGGSRGNPGIAGFGTVVCDGADGAVLAERAGYLGQVSNNVAEYSGLLAGLEAAIEIDPTAAIDVRMDSRLVVEQMSGRWKIKHDGLRQLAEQARGLVAGREVTFTWVPREQNGRADRLANRAMDTRADFRSGDDGATRPDQAPEVIGAPPRSRPGHDDGAKRPDQGQVPAFGPGQPARDDAAPDAARLSSANMPVLDGKPVQGGTTADAVAAARRAQGLMSGSALHPGQGRATTLLLVRHGETPDTATRVYAGSGVPGPSLTAAGRDQGAAAARLLRIIADGLWPDIDAPSVLVASPMTRTRETAGILGRTLGLEAIEDAAFAEINFGQWEGMAPAAIEQAWPGGTNQWRRDPDARPGGGESRNQVLARVRSGIERVVQRWPGQTVVLASHGVAIKAAIGVALGAPPEVWGSFRIVPGSLTALSFWPGGLAELRASNWSLIGL